MKTKCTILVVLAALLFASCSSTRDLADDVYYNPKDDVRAEKRTAKQDEKNADQSDEYATLKELEGTGAYGAAQYSEPDEMLTVYEDDTLYLEDYELGNEGEDLVVNNYYEGSGSSNYSYSSALSRFHGPSYGFSYYSPYYDPWYWGGPSLGVSFNWGYGFYNSYYSPYYYRPYYYSPYYSYYPYYNDSWYYSPGYYNPYSPVYVVDGYHSNRTYGHRRSVSTDRRRSYNPYNQTADAYYRGSGTASDRSVRRSEDVTARVSRNTDRTLPDGDNKAVARTSTAKSSSTQTNDVKRYVPTYSNPKTNTRARYNYSRSGSANSATTGKSRQSYNARSGSTGSATKAPVRSNSKASTPRYSGSSRTNSSYNRSSGSGSSTRSYSRSSGSSSRSSGSYSRSSGSSSRSSGSSYRSGGSSRSSGSSGSSYKSSGSSSRSSGSKSSGSSSSRSSSSGGRRR